MRGGRRHIHLHTPGTGSRRRRAAAWRGTPGAEVVEEIQTGSWLWGPGRFCQAPQCKPRRGGRGAPFRLRLQTGPPRPPLPRLGGARGTHPASGPTKKKSCSKPLQPLRPSQHRRHRKEVPRSPTAPISTHGTVEASKQPCMYIVAVLYCSSMLLLVLSKVARLLAHTQLLCTPSPLLKSEDGLKWFFFGVALPGNGSAFFQPCSSNGPHGVQSNTLVEFKTIQEKTEVVSKRSKRPELDARSTTRPRTKSGLIPQTPGVLPDSYLVTPIDQWVRPMDPKRSVRRRHPSNPWRKKPEGGGEKMGIRTHSPRPPQPRHRKNNSHHSPGTVRNPAHQSTTLARPRPPRQLVEKDVREEGVTHLAFIVNLWWFT